MVPAVDSSTDGHGGGCKAAAGVGDTSVDSSQASSNGVKTSRERRRRHGGGNALYLVSLPSNGAGASVHPTVHGSTAGSIDGRMDDRSSSRERRSEADDSASNGRSTEGVPGGGTRHSRHRCSSGEGSNGGGVMATVPRAVPEPAHGCGLSHPP